MPLSKPYFRIHRSREADFRSSFGEYVLDNRYAPDYHNLIRAYYVIQDDLERLFEYIEPADGNERTYSVRTFELLLRACVEIEANCKTILRSNGYKPGKEDDWTMKDYSKIERATRLSEYKARLRSWHSRTYEIRPFAGWASSEPLPWYRAYNTCKHNRAAMFKEATLENSIAAVAALYCILFAQFGWRVADGRKAGFHDFYRFHEAPLMLEIPGSLFDIIPFTNWTDDERYEFCWERDLEKSPEPFAKFDFEN